MIKGKSEINAVPGVSHPEKGKSWRSVTFKMEQEDGDKVLQAAKDSIKLGAVCIVLMFHSEGDFSRF